MRFKLLLITLLVSCFGWGQVNITPIRTDVSGFSTWTDIDIEGTTYLQLLKSSSSSVSPSFNFNLYSNETLNFKARSFGGTSTIENTITISISIDNAVNWIVLGTRIPSSSTMASQNSFDISSYNGTQIKIKFTVAGTSNTIGAGIDDVTISGTPASTTYTTSWSNSAPTSTIDAIINGDLSTSVDLACKDLTINAGKTLTLEAGKKLTVSGNLVNNGTIVFKSDATATAMFDVFNGSQSGSGSVTVERFIPAKRAYRFVSSPITTTTTIKENWQENASSTAGLGTQITGTGGATNGFDATASNNPSMFTFDNGAWAEVTNTNVNVLNAGTPYRLMVRGDRTTDLTTNTPTATATTLRATGTLKTGNFTPTINQTADGFSLVGNPYQAPIDIKAILTASSNMNAGVVYYWDPTLNTRGGYVTRDLIANSNDVISTFNQYVQPGQAVFVKRDNTANVASVSIAESNKSVANGSAGLFRSATTNEYGLLRVNLQANVNNQWQAIEGALALFNPLFTTNVTQEDATKMSNLDEEVSFVQNSTALAIACQPNPSITDELPIKFNNIRHSNYQWQFELDNYNGATPYLFDAQNNTFTVISNGTIVPFTADATTANRFKIVFQNAALNNPEFATTIVMYPNPAKNGSGFLLQGVSPKSSVVLYTTLGQSIAVSTTEYESGLQVTPKTLISSGVYIVSITTEGKTSQVKWIVE
ncbi:MAG: T9SS type A sorting domain-containing protein [Flavobacterium sp.]